MYFWLKNLVHVIQLLSIIIDYDKEVQTVMVNNSTNINKTNDNLSPQTNEEGQGGSMS